MGITACFVVYDNGQVIAYIIKCGSKTDCSPSVGYHGHAPAEDQIVGRDRNPIGRTRKRAFVLDERGLRGINEWEFKFTKDYQNLTSSIGTKAGEAVVQGADVLLIDIVRTNRFSTKAVVDGVGNSFYYNPSLQKICVMIESERFVIVERKWYDDGTYIAALNKFL